MVSESTGTLSYQSDDKVPIFYRLFSCISHNKYTYLIKNYYRQTYEQ